MAIKLFNRKESDPYDKLDSLMQEMASIESYLEYLQLRERV